MGFGTGTRMAPNKSIMVEKMWVMTSAVEERVGEGRPYTLNPTLSTGSRLYAPSSLALSAQVGRGKCRAALSDGANVRFFCHSKGCLPQLSFANFDGRGYQSGPLLRKSYAKPQRDEDPSATMP